MIQASTTYAADHYVQRLDLGADPFALDYSGDRFYAGAMRRELLDQLIHYGRFSEQPVLLVGSTGSGSSTLLDAMISQLQQVMDCCVVNAEWVVSPEQLLASLSEQLQLDAAETPAEFLLALKSSAVIEGEPEPVLIAIDQAHYMPLESFELLKYFQEQAEGVIHLLVAGEYQIEQLAGLAGFGYGDRKLLELESLTASETGDYLLGLLQSAGYAGEQPLSSDQLMVLHEQSGGNIAQIKKLSPALLAVDRVASGRSLNFAIPSAHIVAIIILVVALLISYFYQGGAELSELSEPLPVADVLVDVVPGSKKEVTVPLGSPTKEPLIKETVRAKPVSPTPVASIRTTIPATAASKSATTPTAPLRTISEAPAVVKADKPSGVVASRRGESVSPIQPEPAKPIANVTAAVPAPPSVPAVEKQAPKKVTTSSVSKRPAMKTVAKNTIPVRESRLLGLPAGVYMLQLFGTVDEQRARDFVKHYVGRLPITYFETSRNTKPWFVAVTGPYDNKSAATAGINLLPVELQKQKPWARTVASVQKDIKANR